MTGAAVRSLRHFSVMDIGPESAPPINGGVMNHCQGSLRDLQGFIT